MIAVVVLPVCILFVQAAIFIAALLVGQAVIHAIQDNTDWHKELD